MYRLEYFDFICLCETINNKKKKSKNSSCIRQSSVYILARFILLRLALSEDFCPINKGFDPGGLAYCTLSYNLFWSQMQFLSNMLNIKILRLKIFFSGWFLIKKKLYLHFFWWNNPCFFLWYFRKGSASMYAVCMRRIYKCICISSR